MGSSYLSIWEWNTTKLIRKWYNIYFKKAFLPCFLLHRAGLKPAWRNCSKANFSWQPSACHVFNADNITPPFGKPGGWRSALLLVKALLGNFYFISLQVFIALSMEWYESNISPRLLVRSLWKMRFLALNPPVSTQGGGFAALSFCARIYWHMFVCITTR